jgi:aldehyde dehydrogenase (NAD(P)+)
VHNALLLKDTERTVLRGPFHPRPKPSRFLTNRTAGLTAQRLTAFAARHKAGALAGILASAVRG